MMENSTPTTPTRHSEMAHLSETLETDPEVWGEGADRMDSVSREPISHGLHFKPPVEPLLLLLQAIQLDGKPFQERASLQWQWGLRCNRLQGLGPSI